MVLYHCRYLIVQQPYIICRIAAKAAAVEAEVDNALLEDAGNGEAGEESAV